MADFDWENESTPPTSGGTFDWEKESQPSGTGGPTSSAAGAALRGFGQGLTADFGDEMGAGLQSGLQGLANTLPEGSLEWAGIDNRYAQDAGEVYRQARGENRRQLEADREQHGTASTLGNLAGSIVLSTIAPGEAGYGQAAALGAASGLGSSEADLTRGDVLGATRDTALGAGMGLAGQYVGNKVGAAVPRVARAVREYLGETAAAKALKAAGYIQKDLKPMIRRDPGSVVRQGRVLLEEPGVITPGATVEDIAERLGTRVDAYGDQIGRALQEADQLGARFDPEPFLQRVEQDIIAPVAHDPAVRGEVQELQRLVNAYRANAQGTVGGQAVNLGLGFAEANALKTNLQKTINFGNHWNTGGPGENAERFLRQMQGHFHEEIDRQLGQVLDDGSFATFRDAKARYGPLREAIDKARQGIARDGGNNTFRLQDYIAGAAGSALGPVGSIAAPVASKVLRERGDSVVAVAANRAARSGALDSIAASQPSSARAVRRPSPLRARPGPRRAARAGTRAHADRPEWRQMREQQQTQGQQ